MMAFLFIMLLAAIGFATFNRPKVAITLAFINLFLMLLMFWHHVTTPIQINL